MDPFWDMIAEMGVLFAIFYIVILVVGLGMLALIGWGLWEAITWLSHQNDIAQMISALLS